MLHRLLGFSGLRVSEICLGTLTFGEGREWGAGREAALDILSAYADVGGTFLDSAPTYADGAAEEIVGEFCAGQRDDFVIATKFTAAASPHPLAGGNSRKSLKQSLEASLKRLRTDHVDLLWLHYWDGTTPLDEILRALDDLVTAGKVLYIGLSDTPAWLASRAATLAELRGWSRVIAIQLEYNIASRTPERDLLPMAEALDLGRVCWGVLGAGLFGGGASTRRKAASLSPAQAVVAERVRQIAAQAGLPVPVLALRWVMRRNAASPLIPIIGARTPGQVRDLLGGATAFVDESVMAQLDEIAAPEPGFPLGLIGSSYLRRLACGDPERLALPDRRRC